MSRIAYDLSLIKAFAFDVDGVLSPSTIPVDAEGTPMRMANIKDGYALQLAARLGYPIAIITGGRSNAVVGRYTALGIKDIFQGCALKLPVFTQWLADRNLEAEQVLYMGDDIPDLPVLRNTGLPCCPYDAAFEVKAESRYISPHGGGYGCVRDVVQQVLAAHGQWLSDLHAFGW
ncbi:MAG: 3-deoxy-D-manno-octulosonate 8-phosphate phosphatase [Muribaculaceae bacterium]|nr:3-deoxy-D-manno-octulosonate 8-phosphate phosphatase [Muribaculaceae bacterium]